MFTFWYDPIPDGVASWIGECGFEDVGFALVLGVIGGEDCRADDLRFPGVLSASSMAGIVGSCRPLGAPRARLGICVLSSELSLPPVSILCEEFDCVPAAGAAAYVQRKKTRCRYCLQPSLSQGHSIPHVSSEGDLRLITCELVFLDCIPQIIDSTDVADGFKETSLRHFSIADTEGSLGPMVDGRHVHVDLLAFEMLYMIWVFARWCGWIPIRIYNIYIYRYIHIYRYTHILYIYMYIYICIRVCEYMYVCISLYIYYT